jgi:hypothetical protein
VAVGTTMRTTVALRIGIGTIQTTGTTTTGSGLYCPQLIEEHCFNEQNSFQSFFLRRINFQKLLSKA